MSPPPAATAGAESFSFPESLRPAAPVPKAERAASRPAERADRPLLGIAMILGASIFFATADTLTKILTAGLPTIQVGFLRYVVFALIAVPLGMAMHGRAVFRTQRPGLQILRGAGMVASSLIFIFGLTFLQVADATAAAFVAPIFITALSVVFLRETVGIRRWIATAVGLVGVLIVVRPGADILQSAGLIPVVSAFIWACSAVITRIMAGVDKPETTLVYSAVIGLAILGAAVPFVWVTPTPHQLLLGLGIGVGSTIGHWLLVIGFRHAQASLLAPISYSQLIWASLFGYVAFGVLPTVPTVVGGTIIAASGLYIAHRERVRAREAGRAAA